MAKPKISAVLIVKNEESNIRRVLESVSWADEIVVLDTGSVDRTIEVCREFGARIEQGDWHGFVEDKNIATELAAGEWILSMDADEEVTQSLQEEIEAIISDPGAKDGYKIPRKNHYRGRWIRHCGWYPDLQLRLWRKGKGMWVGGRVHEHVELTGSIGRTTNAINHYTYVSIQEHQDRMNKYSDLCALDKFDSGKHAGFFGIFFAAPWQFFRIYFLRLGFLDGISGLIVSAMGAHYAFLKKAKLRELQMQKK